MSVKCRAFLREAPGSPRGLDPASVDRASVEHVTVCDFCRARADARARLVPALTRRPRMPEESGDLLAGVRERIIEQAEESVLGRAVAESMPVAAPSMAVDWSESMLESDLVRRAADIQPRPTAAAWSRVRGAILAQVSVGTTGKVRRMWMLGAVSASASTALVAFLWASLESTATPTIVFRDLDSKDLASMPTVEFAVIRYGASR